MSSKETTASIHASHEPRPDAADLAPARPGSTSNVDYSPDPSKSLEVSPERREIVHCITRLYSGSASESDMGVYANEAIYDDPWSYCTSRYEIAGQWYGIPKLFNSQTLATQIVENSAHTIAYKQRQEYKVKGLGVGHTADSLVTLTLDESGKVKYHKDMWNEKDYSHEGLGKVMKGVNGRYLTKVTRPEESLKKGP